MAITAAIMAVWRAGRGYMALGASLWQLPLLNQGFYPDEHVCMQVPHYPWLIARARVMACVPQCKTNLAYRRPLNLSKCSKSLVCNMRS